MHYTVSTKCTNRSDECTNGSIDYPNEFVECTKGFIKYLVNFQRGSVKHILTFYWVSNRSTDCLVTVYCVSIICCNGK